MKIENLDIKKQFYKSLNERQRRQFAGQLALDLGHGGIKEVCEAFNININPVTVRTVIQELKQGEDFPEGRIRKEGGGRKKKRVKIMMTLFFAGCAFQNS